MSVLDGGIPRGARVRTRPHGNLGVLRIAVFLLFGILTGRLVQLQIIEGPDYARRARENHIVTQAVLPARGLILDRNGEPLVENTGSYAAVVTPDLLPRLREDRQRVYNRLEEIVAVPALEIARRVEEAEELARGGQSITIARSIEKQKAIMLDEASVDMPGVSLSAAPGRRYLDGTAFSGLLGYIGALEREEYIELRGDGYQLNEFIGKTGLEARYQADLRGTLGLRSNEYDAFGNVIEELATQAPVPGNNLRLSIDAGLQRFVAQYLEDTLQEADIAAAVVMSPRTGEVFALVSHPGYDPNIFMELDRREADYRAIVEDHRKPFLNHALFPEAPGSTFKLITAAAGLSEGNVTPATTRYIPSAVLEIKGENGEIYPLYDWKAHGWLNLTGAIAWSSNIYFYQASCGIPQEGIRGLGKNVEASALSLGYYARAFGLGAPTGVDVAGEAPGVIPDPSWKRRVHSGPDFNDEDREWYYADTCFMGIGQQDVTATPLQIARMTAAIANGGRLLTPHIATAVVSHDGRLVREIKPESKPVPVRPEHLAVIRQGMAESVSYGAGAKGAARSVSVAGKTGTAEFGPIKPDGKRDQHAWFTGFAPIENPEVVVTVYYNLGIGGDKAAPAAARIIDYFMENVKR